MIADGAAKDAGSSVGAAAAAAMLAARDDDGRGVPNPITPGAQPGQWRPVGPEFLEFPGSWIAKVKPFFAASPDAYRTTGPPGLESAEYATEFEEVRTMGGATGSSRTPEQDGMVRFWVGPTPQYSALERALITDQKLDITEAARLLAIANMAAGEASIGCFDDKYHWMRWRPATAIAEAASDGNDATEPSADWSSLAQPTPPYPDHPSGWNCVSGAHVGALQAFFGTDDMEFDLLNPDVPEPRHYTSFSQALDEDIELRILQGLHFRSAEVQGAQLGQKAAAAAAEALAPVE